MLKGYLTKETLEMESVKPIMYILLCSFVIITGSSTNFSMNTLSAIFAEKDFWIYCGFISKIACYFFKINTDIVITLKINDFST